ncbi:uncharacterized protein LOC141640662 [Silene latifolia]|uniref:uncharacterized protein LOC141640662 n=1 Tax=Silene latifolia TaxID=37657 RepID=UPI003D77DEB4
MEIVYHERKANMVAYAVSKKSVHALCLAMSRVKLQDELKEMGICVKRKGESVGDLTIEPELYVDVREKQKGDQKVEKWRTAMVEGVPSRFVVGIDGSLKFDGRWCIPDDEELKRKILTEEHSTPYCVHPGGDKLYKDLKKTFSWPGIKKEVAEFVSRCLVCQRVNGEHKRQQGKVQSLDVPEWKWESISMDFIVGLPRTQKANNMIWVVVDRLTKTTHFIPMKDTWSKAELAKAYVRNVVKLHGIPKDIVSDRDSRFISKFQQELQECMGPELIQQMVEQVHVIRQKMKAAQDRQMSYADLKRSEIDFMVGDKVLLKVSPMKGVMRFGKRGKLSQKKYVSDPTHVLVAEIVEMNENLSYEEVAKEILDKKARKTRNSEIALVKVLWSNHNVEEATWEVEAEIKQKYPPLFA